MKDVMSTQKEDLIRTIRQLEIELSDHQADQFLRYYELLIETNRVMNLTAVTEYRDVVRTHFADSLSLRRVAEIAAVKSLIDVGSGAGFPGIPLAILNPEMETVLLDSLGKRVRFLNDTASALGLRNVRAIHGRAEDLARDRAHREHYELAVSRAVARLATLAEYCLPYVNLGGAFVSYKSDRAADEIREAEKAVRVLGGIIEREETFALNGTGRTLVVVRKQKKTPAAYPRKAGLPGKEPIL